MLLALQIETERRVSLVQRLEHTIMAVSDLNLVLYCISLLLPYIPLSPIYKKQATSAVKAVISGHRRQEQEFETE